MPGGWVFGWSATGWSFTEFRQQRAGIERGPDDTGVQGKSAMDKRLALSATVLGIALARPEFAYAGPFDMPPTEYAQSVNRKLQQEGSDLQLMLAGCTAPTRLECRFVSSPITVVVKGRKKPSRIDQVIIATDLLRDDPATPPDEALVDAFTNSSSYNDRV